jgi:hypothetical protein
MKHKIILFSILIIAALAAGFLYNKRQKAGEIIKSNFNPAVSDSVQADKALLNVPFTAQAPLGHWDDPRQEDGCEEASVLMAWLWLHDQANQPTDAEKTIIDMSNFEQDRYGNYHDFNAEDTAKFFKDYYGYQKFYVTKNPTVDDMKKELSQDHLVLVPTNGQKLNNPHYKQPGPTTHMLVIKGFEDSTGQFIVNDPGTKYGESYIYDYNTVYNAMVDYPSGNHGSQEGRPKAMIVVFK